MLILFASRHFRFLPDPRAPGGQRRSSHSHTGNPGNRGYAFWQEHIATSPRNASQACSMSATPSSAGTSLASALLQTLSSIHRDEAGPCGYWYHVVIMPSLQGYRPGPPLKAAPRPINEGSCCSRVSIMGSHPEGPSRSDGILMLSRLRVGSIIERDGYSREQLMRNRRRAEARGRALALARGSLPL